MIRKTSTDPAAQPWAGPWRRYDIVKEGIIAIVVVSILAVLLSAAFSSPDDPAITFKGWAADSPSNFVATATAELAGTSGSATYGPPYNNANDGLNAGPLFMQKWMGVQNPIDSAASFVLDPLRSQAQPTQVTDALAAWDAAAPEQQATWATGFDTALADATAEDGTLDLNTIPAGDYGPVPVLAAGLLGMAQSGALDGILALGGKFFQTDWTHPLLMLSDGTYLEDAAVANHLGGDQWGMMNETGSYPGQAWLWLFSFWYQIPPFNNEEQEPFGANADAYVWFIVAALSIGLAAAPFIPGLRSIPRYIPIHRLIWRRYYHPVD